MFSDHHHRLTSLLPSFLPSFLPSSLLSPRFAHRYFKLFRLYPFRWFRRFCPTIEGFRDWLIEGDDDLYKDDIDGVTHNQAPPADLPEELTEEEREAIEEKRRKQEALMNAVAALDPDELSYLHKLEIPKLSLIRELTHVEDQQRGMLAHIEELNRRSRDVATGYMKLMEKKEAIRAARRKEKKLEEEGRVTTLLEED